MLFGSRPGPWPIGLGPGPMGPGPGEEELVDHFHDISITFAVWWLLQHKPLRHGARDMQQPEKISATSGWLSVEGRRRVCFKGPRVTHSLALFSNR